MAAGLPTASTCRDCDHHRTRPGRNPRGLLGGVASGEGVHGAAALLVWFVLFYEALTVIVAAMAQARQRQRDEH